MFQFTRELKQENGGCFKDMKVLFMLDSEPRVKAYTDVVLAGGGTVIQNKTFKDLIKNVPGMESFYANCFYTYAVMFC